MDHEDEPVSTFKSVDQNKNPYDCNQVWSPRIFEQSVFKFQHAIIYIRLHGSV